MKYKDMVKNKKLTEFKDDPYWICPLCKSFTLKGDKCGC